MEAVKKNKVKLILVYLLFVFINIAVNRLVKHFGLPLYVDNIGTLLGAVLGGYLPGIFVGYITNIINSTADPTNMYYAGISVLIAITATYFAEKGYFKNFFKSLLTIPFLAFFGGVVGSVLTWFIFGPSESGFFGQISHDFLLDIIDKAITVVCAYGLMKVMPKDTAAILSLTDWRQKPLSNEEINEVKSTGTRGLSLKSEISILVCVIMLFITVATSTISFILYRNQSMEQYKEMGINAAKIAAASLDPEKIDEYIEMGEASPDYLKAEEKLTEILHSSASIKYIYVYRMTPNGYKVVFDLDTDELQGEEPGAVIPYEEDFLPHVADLMAGRNVDPVIVKDRYGWLLTDYEPVFDKNGNCVCYACADINMEDITSNGISFLAKVLSLFIGFFILVLVLSLWFFNYHLTYPVGAMTHASGEFAYNSEQALEVSVDRLKSLDISTANELENLYQVLVKTLSDTVRYLEEVKEKSEQIEFMQSGLIYVLADLVESRDKCTGDHIRKTAAYVRLIQELLKENNIYSENMNDEEYVKCVNYAAPLHDVGKIAVSDVILNKPGRLTDDEFEEMKKHTTTGMDIIERAIKLTGDTGYLKEALNVAAYHHEKWDGSGYPTGLKGKAIPLSARIMAVSDVFDALLSKRSYKDPMSYETAFKIIEEGAGKHFDPAIAKVFVENKDRVIATAEDNKERFGQGNDPEPIF
ncbi:MAG: HD domain-containing protein [Lachnospiraceae bacterium]|nr:HD domain-containing protein [Lachnospiraceae bacterium]